MEYCHCGRQAKIRCTSCGNLVCDGHSGFAPTNGQRVTVSKLVCSSCIAKAAEDSELVELNSVLDRTGILRVVAALSATGGLTDQGFARYRGLGVEFRTSSPWEEVKSLYRDFPIRDARTSYFLWVRTTTMFGSTANIHDIGEVPGIPMFTYSSEGYTTYVGLVTPNGSVLPPWTSDGANKHQVTSDSSSDGWTGSGVGYNLLRAFKTVREYRSLILQYSQARPSFYYSDARVKPLMTSMFEVWRGNATGIAIPDDLRQR